MSTGRLNSLQGANDYSRTLNAKEPSSSFVHVALKGNHEITPLSKLFFSKMNIDFLQIGIRNKILNATNGKHNIGRQSDDELLAIMMGIYNEHARHLPFDIVEQVKELNITVLHYSVRIIMSELKMNEKYLHDIQNYPVPLPAAINTSVKGSKVIEMKSFM